MNLNRDLGCAATDTARYTFEYLFNRDLDGAALDMNTLSFRHTHSWVQDLDGEAPDTDTCTTET